MYIYNIYICSPPQDLPMLTHICIYIYIIPVFLNISAKKCVKANSLQHYLFIFTCTLHPFGRGISFRNGRGFGRGGTSILSRRSPINNECSIVGQGGSRNIKLWISRRFPNVTAFGVLGETMGIPRNPCIFTGDVSICCGFKTFIFHGFGVQG